jgi:hypothetical protein
MRIEILPEPLADFAQDGRLPSWVRTIGGAVSAVCELL